MRKFRLLLLISLLITTISFTKAEQFLNIGQFYTIYFGNIGSDLPKSYKYIQLNFKNAPQTGKIYDALQRGVYLDLLPNQDINLQLNKKISQKQVATLVKSNFGLDIGYSSGLVDTTRLLAIMMQLQEQNYQNISTQDEIMQHVYDTLKYSYFYQDKLKDDTMSYGAIKGMVKSLDDPYTEFFDPQETKEFNDDINGEFEGIGAYLEKNKKGEIIIVSPLKGSPAEKAGLQTQDIIIEINNKKISSDTNLSEVIKMIKGPAGTSVKLKIQRGDKEINFTVTRDRITIQNIETKILDNQYCYMAIHMFSMGIDKDFDSNINNLQNCPKYIFDVRNNPGGGLREVSDILGYFVPTGKATVNIKDRYGNEDLKAKDKGRKIGKDIMILINGGSASASEIFAGTIKDYIPSTLLIGEKTFGKGSVQSIIDYVDGSMLKYTQAKRYTGKSNKNIDKEGIDPDIKIQDNPDTPNDEILETIQKINFTK